MRPPVTAVYAFRSLWRHTRRTILSVLGIGMGCGVGLFLVSLVRGEVEMLMRAAAESGAGHLQIVSKEYERTRSRDLRLPGWEEHLAAMRARPEVEVATPRAQCEGLLAFGTRVCGTLVTGVDPVAEQAANRLVSDAKIAEGRYLRPDDAKAVVVGRTIADRLDVEAGDDLMVTVSSKDGDIGAAMWPITGIVETGSRELDLMVCHVPLHELERISGYEGATNLVLLLKHPRKHVEPLKEELSASLPADLAVMSWREIMPEISSAQKQDVTWVRITITVMMIVVFLGIASAQLAAVLERRREFAVLSALGMKGGALVRIMLVEGFVLGSLGGLAGLLIGGGAAYYGFRWGIDFRPLYGDADLTVSSILLDPIIFADFGWWLVPMGFLISLTATLFSSFYPAWYAAKTDPATALRVDH